MSERPGAHEGGYGQLLRDIGYAGEIVSLEPVNEPFAVLEGRARLDPRWRVHKLALGERTESLPLNVTRERNFSSFLRPAAHAVERFPGGPQVERRGSQPSRRGSPGRASWVSSRSTWRRWLATSGCGSSRWTA